MTAHALALVESPLQLLCALETLRRHERMHVHFRMDAEQAKAIIASLREDRLPDSIDFITWKAAKRMLAQRPQRIIIGDPCSGRIQRHLTSGYAVSKLPEITIVDDGLSSIDVMEQLVLSDKPISRPRNRLSQARRALSAVFSSRLRGLLRKDRLTWVTALSIDAVFADRLRDAGLTVEHHTFAFLSALPSSKKTAPSRIVLGSALASDGLLRRDAYLGWLSRRAAEGPFAYYPHRREKEHDLDAVRALPGVEIADVGLPVEIRLRGLSKGTEVLSLPSTAAVNLAVVSPKARVRVHPIDEDWWESSAPKEFRRVVDRIPHGLLDSEGVR